MVAAGGIIYASDMNKALASRLPYAHVADTGSSSAITTTEGVALTIPSQLYKANTAFQVVVEGILTGASSCTRCYTRLRKGSTTSGALVAEWSGLPMTVNGTFWGGVTKRFTTGGAAVTTALSLTLQANVGTVTHTGTGGQPRCVDIIEIGDQADWPDLPDLT